ncbi:HEAT repeat family protein [Rhodococcus sp. MTM3W5.2]|nr:HEAT repeat family protein [Rhodococcus sp. MTM3W5.2]
MRSTAIATLTEATPDGFDNLLVDALGDEDAAVRRTAAEGLRELVEVLPAADGLALHLASGDAIVRSTVVDLLRALRTGTAAQYRAALADVDHRVRIESVRALVSLDDWQTVATASEDENREVRIASAQGLATIGLGVSRRSAPSRPIVTPSSARPR